MTKSGVCPECQGKGWIELSSRPDEARVCGLCRGTGVTSLDTQCHGCRGTGRIEVRTVEQQKCLKCEGTGRFPVPEEL
jgi:DnaJ-class molecular chaperone